MMVCVSNLRVDPWSVVDVGGHFWNRENEIFRLRLTRIHIWVDNHTSIRYEHVDVSRWHLEHYIASFNFNLDRKNNEIRKAYFVGKDSVDKPTGE
jgi:hypothetical protein